MFYWLARQSRRNYGLLYFRDDDIEPGQPYRFRVQRISGGEIEEFADPVFEHD